MSARHDAPLRAYRTRAQFLLDDLDDPDPAVSRLAARFFGWLPRFASSVDAWRTLTRADVRYSDALNVVAREMGAQNWRDFVANGSPPEHAKQWAEIYAASCRDDIRLQRELSGYACTYAITCGWEHIKLGLPPEPWDSDPHPQTTPIDGPKGSYQPDVSGVHEGLEHLLAVQRAGPLARPDGLPRLRTFAAQAAKTGAVFQLFTDADSDEAVRRCLKRARIQAEVIVSVGMYRHEIEDAIAADWGRDTH